MLPNYMHYYKRNYTACMTIWLTRKTYCTVRLYVLYVATTTQHSIQDKEYGTASRTANFMFKKAKKNPLRVTMKSIERGEEEKRKRGWSDKEQSTSVRERSWRDAERKCIHDLMGNGDKSNAYLKSCLIWSLLLRRIIIQSWSAPYTLRIKLFVQFETLIWCLNWPLQWNAV